MADPFAAIRGELLFTCGEDPLRADAYLKERSGAVRRLTRDQLVTTVRWVEDDVLLVSGISGGIHRRTLTTDPSVPGRLVAGRNGPAGAPAVSPTGALAYQRLGETPSGRLFDKVVVAQDGRRRSLARFRWVFDLHWIRDRLYAHVRRRGITRLVDVERRTATRLGRHVGLAATTPDGRVAMNQAGRFTVMRVDGRHRRTFRTGWFPLDWSPDGTQVLVANADREIGLMDPRSGQVSSAGPSGCGYVVSADWRR